MLRLAFDFIITWRETRTRPNAYAVPLVFPCPAKPINTQNGGIICVLEFNNPSVVIRPSTSKTNFLFSSPELIHIIFPPQYSGRRVLGVPPVIIEVKSDIRFTSQSSGIIPNSVCLYPCGISITYVLIIFNYPAL